MHWKLKAFIQRAVSLLPSGTSYSTYYWIQQKFGGLARMDPSHGLFVGIESWKRLRKLGYDPAGKVFFEVGTGRAPIVPLAYHLMGASQTITIDLNPYLKRELFENALRHISENPDQIRALFGPLLDEKRWDELLGYYKNRPFELKPFLDLCGIEYIAPGDAANTRLAAKTVDFHTSNTTLEHIPPEVLGSILREGNRLLRDNGLFIHRIDYSDHFSHTDKRISPINFLQYSDEIWNRYANNRYMYMNRLRHDDLLEIFRAGGHHIVGDEPDVNPRLLDALKSGQVQVDSRFGAKPMEVIATTGAWIMASKGPIPQPTMVLEGF